MTVSGRTIRRRPTDICYCVPCASKEIRPPRGLLVRPSVKWIALKRAVALNALAPRWTCQLARSSLVFEVRPASRAAAVKRKVADARDSHDDSRIKRSFALFWRGEAKAGRATIQTAGERRCKSPTRTATYMDRVTMSMHTLSHTHTHIRASTHIAHPILLPPSHACGGGGPTGRPPPRPEVRPSHRR